MRNDQEDTPPSSINGDEISMDDEGINFEEMEEIQLDYEDLDEMIYAEDIEKPEDHATLVFEKHTGSIFCCDLHPNGKLAITGGEDDRAYVWSVETGQVVMECTGHKDSVIFVGFSFDGAFVASVDMSGRIKVWKCKLEDDQQEEWPIAFEYEAEDMSWGLWHFGARVLLCGAVTGDIFIFKIPSGDTKVLQGHNVKTECGKIFQDGVRLATGYEDGTIKFWDLKTTKMLHQVSPAIHQIRVTALDTHPENSLVASIGTDGKLVLTTSNNAKVVCQLQTEIDLEVVAFSPDPQLELFALGTLNGSVTVWDTARQMIRHHCAKTTDDVAAGVTKMIWVDDQVVTGCLDGSVRVYDARSGRRSLTLTGHWSEILDLCYNAKEKLILTTSDDGTARIYKYAIKTENE